MSSQLAVTILTGVPGDAKASKLIARIESTDETEQMPPPKTKKPLSALQKRLLRTWIEQGAGYSQHWAFTPPQRAERLP